MKFLTDRNLGKLLKWLRILGYDTVPHHGDINRTFLERGRAEGRVVLSRRRDLVKRNYRGQLVIIYADTVAQQIEEVVNKLGLQPDPARYFTRCLRCNGLLSEVSKTAIGNAVPPYVRYTQERFLVCTTCNAVFWAGTHRDNMLKTLTEHNLMDHL